MVSGLKQFVFRAAHSRTFSRTVQMFDRWESQRNDLLRVLTYHRVDHCDAYPELDPVLLSASPARFAKQMEMVARHFAPVSIEQVIAAVQQEQFLPPQAVLITFDDAYRSFRMHAWPVLKRLGIPCVQFVATGFVDQREHSFWWDRVHQAVCEADAIQQLETRMGNWSLSSKADRQRCLTELSSRIRALQDEQAQGFVQELCDQLNCRTIANHVMNWAELRQLADEGLALAPHSRHHPLLTRVSTERARHEIHDSIADLKDRTGQSIAAFSYPLGAQAVNLEPLLSNAGIKIAFTTQRGVNDLSLANPLQLQRINVGRFTPTALLHAQMLSWFPSIGSD